MIQLVYQKDSIPVEIAEQLSHPSATTKFQAICTAFELVYIFIDALDEWPSNKRLGVLRELKNVRPKLRLFTAGHKQIVRQITGIFPNALEIPLCAEREGIEAHIRKAVHRQRNNLFS